MGLRLPMLFLYQHQADLYPRVDRYTMRADDSQAPKGDFLALELGVCPGSNTAATAISDDRAMQLLLEAHGSHGVVSVDRFLTLLSDSTSLKSW